MGDSIVLENPTLNHERKVITIIVTFVVLLKTFFFLRIFKGLSYLVLMMKQVSKDLIPFMTFYFLLLWIQGQVFNIIGVGNMEHKSNEYLSADDNKMYYLYIKNLYPGIEYHDLPIFCR